MNQSSQSFYSEKPVDDEQAARVKKIAKPFAVGQKKQKPTAAEVEDDLLSEVSTPGLEQDMAA